MSGGFVPVKVSVAGEEVTIRSEQPAEHSIAVAHHVDQSIRRIQDQSPLVDTGKAAILAALQIADELFRTRNDSERGAERLEQTMEDIRRMLPPAKRNVGR
ncbi:MAG TPA: cell division protein ZapA [Gemmatimonadaceae bacterium]|nr:cell division protein ZapA [Gemmatimonadaceae bacterium]